MATLVLPVPHAICSSSFNDCRKRRRGGAVHDAGLEGLCGDRQPPLAGTNVKKDKCTTPNCTFLARVTRARGVKVA
eukprot:scaffold14782_cov146-Isochrysis_galbana.AAC.4